MSYTKEEARERDKNRKYCYRLPDQLKIMEGKVERVKAVVSPWDEQVEKALKEMADMCQEAIDYMAYQRKNYESYTGCNSFYDYRAPGHPYFNFDKDFDYTKRLEKYKTDKAKK